MNKATAHTVLLGIAVSLIAAYIYDKAKALKQSSAPLSSSSAGHAQYYQDLNTFISTSPYLDAFMKENGVILN